MYKRILVAIENSPADQTILAHVTDLARLTGASLLLVHVADGFAARYFDDLKLKDIARTFGYHEATASRKIVRVQNEIRKSVEKALRTQHGWKDTEVRRYLSETAAGLGISFEKLLSILVLAALMQDFWRQGVL